MLVELRCALCHLDEQGEADQYCQGHIPGLAVIDVAKSEEEDRFEEERQELGPNASAEPEKLEHEVTGDPAQRSSEEVHQAEGSSQGRCVTGRHLEIGPEMGCQLVVPRLESGQNRNVSATCTLRVDAHKCLLQPGFMASSVP